jgi:hypothetical protein
MPASPRGVTTQFPLGYVSFMWDYQPKCDNKYPEDLKIPFEPLMSEALQKF